MLPVLFYLVTRDNIASCLVSEVMFSMGIVQHLVYPVGDLAWRKEIEEKSVTPIFDYLPDRGSGRTQNDTSCRHSFQYRPGEDKRNSEIYVRRGDLQRLEVGFVRHEAKKMNTVLIDCYLFQEIPAIARSLGQYRRLPPCPLSG